MSDTRMIDAIQGQKKHRELAARLGKVLFYGTFGLLLVGPLAFGAVEPWSIFMIEAGAAGLLAVWIGKQVIENRIKIRVNSLFVPAGIFGVLIASQLAFRMSAYPHATISAALLYASYAVLCFLVSQILERGSQARRLAFLVSIYGAAVASFAMIQGIASNGKLYWLRQPHMGGWIYGPYVNHNHYAGLMEMLIPIPLVLSLTHLAPSRARNLAATAAAVMVGTIFLSGSRGGMLAIVTELAILGFIVVQHRRGWHNLIGAGLFMAIVTGLLIWVGGSDLTQRIASVEASHSELSRDIRGDINRDGVRMFLKKPIFGWGLGTFPVVYPEFRTFHTNFFVNEAHNDYLQLLVETGLAGFAVIIFMVVVAFKRAIKKLKNWTTEMNGAAALACLLGMSGILVHSALDFNLKVPANAALFYVLCTVAASPRFLKPAHRQHRVHSFPEDETKNPQEASPQPAATNF